LYCIVTFILVFNLFLNVAFIFYVFCKAPWIALLLKRAKIALPCLTKDFKSFKTKKVWKLAFLIHKILTQARQGNYTISAVLIMRIKFNFIEQLS